MSKSLQECSSMECKVMSFSLPVLKIHKCKSYSIFSDKSSQILIMMVFYFHRLLSLQITSILSVWVQCWRRLEKLSKDNSTNYLWFRCKESMTNQIWKSTRKKQDKLLIKLIKSLFLITITQKVMKVSQSPSVLWNGLNKIMTFTVKFTQNRS